MLFTVGSTNPNFSYIIQKNPNTIRESSTPFTRSLKKGKIYGWFTNLDNSEFRLWFKDSETEVSFSDTHEIEYIDKTRYSHPYGVFQIISDTLRAAYHGDPERDVEGYSAYAESIIRSKGYLLLSKFGYPGLTITPLISDYYHIRVSSSTVKDVLVKFLVICIITAIHNDDLYISLKKDSILRFIKLINESHAPYLVRATFLTKFITNPDFFNHLKVENFIDTPEMEFQFGNAQLQRLEVVSKALLQKDKSEILIDIGCGELYHSKKLSTEYEVVHAYDKDKEVVEKNLRKLKTLDFGDNIRCINQEVTPSFILENTSLIEGSDVILIETLEHLEIEKAKILLKAIIEVKPNRIVITVPNREFNKNFNFDESDFRHPDHKWEPNKDELIKFLGDAGVPKSSYTIEDVGNKVNGQPITLAVTWKP